MYIFSTSNQKQDAFHGETAQISAQSIKAWRAA